MTAAERFARMARLDALSHTLSIGNVFLVGGAVLLIVSLASYRSGKRVGDELARSAARAVMIAQLADSSKAIEAREQARHDALHFADQAEAAARAIHQTAREKIRLISDTVISVVRSTDTVRVEVPREIVTTIAASDALHHADSVLIDLYKLQLADVSNDRDLWQHRALLDEETLKHTRAPRFGFKSGVVAGVLAVVAVGFSLK